MLWSHIPPSHRHPFRPSPQLADTFLKACSDAYSTLVARQKAIKNKASEMDKKGRASQADDLIQFRQLRAQVPRLSEPLSRPI